jgi:hypothetical protein
MTTIFSKQAARSKKLNVINPVQRVGSVKQMLHYLGGVDEYADRDRFPQPAMIIVAMHLPGGDGLSAQAMIAQTSPIVKCRWLSWARPTKLAAYAPRPRSALTAT